MKVLMICTEKLPVPPILGGAIQTYISGILPHLSKHHEITVLGVNDESLPDKETVDGIQYVRIPGKVFDIYKEGVISYVESNQFDLIHIFNRPRLVMPVRKLAPHSKITLSMHNDMFKLEKIDSPEAEAVIDEVSNIVTISNYIGDVIKQQYPQAASKLHTIYSGVDSERFLPGSHPKMRNIRNELRKKHGLEGKTVLLFTGRLSHNKGVDKLVRALPKLSRRFRNLALVIVGSNWFSQNDVTDYVAYVRALAKKAPIPIVTTGFVAPSEIQNWYAASDLFVCTSQWQEPLARVHYEAMAAGLPIITTARGGNPEVILLRENGLVVERPGDPDDFVEKITEILSSTSLMKKMGEKGRELAVSRYQWDRVASDLLAVWELSMQAPLSTIAQDAPNGNIIDFEEAKEMKLEQEREAEHNSIPEQEKVSEHYSHREYEKEAERYSRHEREREEARRERREREREEARRERREREREEARRERREREREEARRERREREREEARRERRERGREETHHERRERKKEHARYTRHERKRDTKRNASREREREAQHHRSSHHHIRKDRRTAIKKEKIVKSINYIWKPNNNKSTYVSK
ncbi:glycosyltransferase family 4 protein [Heyndrickxia sp. NPDC080065]|uniref:glycosyltransferase family 4 protein n=1 Tax=Heyndrickxia sp. NPDC080065 TaxID=3390568 RepID=UPI003D0013E2